MKKLGLILAILIALMVFSCEYEESGHQCGSNERDRIGAICNDGSRSNATGAGACSHHGGVDYWLCGD